MHNQVQFGGLTSRWDQVIVGSGCHVGANMRVRVLTYETYRKFVIQSVDQSKGFVEYFVILILIVSSTAHVTTISMLLYSCDVITVNNVREVQQQRLQRQQ